MGKENRIIKVTEAEKCIVLEKLSKPLLLQYVQQGSGWNVEHLIRDLKDALKNFDFILQAKGSR